LKDDGSLLQLRTIVVTPVKTGTPVTQQKTAAKTPPTASSNTTTAPPKNTPPPVKKQTVTTVPPKTSSVPKQPVTGTQKPKTQAPSNGTRELAENKTLQKPAVVDKPQTKIDNPQSPAVISSKNGNKLETRTKQFIKLIEVPESTFKIDLYDNGQVDGDTISVFFNNKLIVSSKRLSTTPITVNVKLDPDKVENELVMYAENLGSIPPNTALMVVTVGDKRYEVNITSTDKTNGTVRFKLKE
jgi:hypothetical protein